MIQVNVSVEIAEIPSGAEDDEPSSLAWGYDLRVQSHCEDPTVAVLILDGKRYAVAAKDLIAAVQNASNTGER